MDSEFGGISETTVAGFAPGTTTCQTVKPDFWFGVVVVSHTLTSLLKYAQIKRLIIVSYCRKIQRMTIVEIRFLRPLRGILLEPLVAGPLTLYLLLVREVVVEIVTVALGLTRHLPVETVSK